MRERMRKLTAAILMLVMVSVMFTACGSNSSDKSDNATCLLYTSDAADD